MAFSIRCLPGKETVSEIWEEYLEEEGLEPRGRVPEDDWTSLSKKVKSLFKRNGLSVNELESLHHRVKRLLTTKGGQFLFDWCQTKLFKECVAILHDSITANKDVTDLTNQTDQTEQTEQTEQTDQTDRYNRQTKQTLDSLEDVWKYFYGEILPTLQAIFVPLLERPQKLTIRQAALVAFRNGIVLPLNLEKLLIDPKNVSPAVVDPKKVSPAVVDSKQVTPALIDPKNVSPTIRQMLLVLQDVQDEYPPNAEREALEKLVALVIVPYMGFHGYYKGKSEPEIESTEPQLALRRRSSGETKKLSRPLSVQPPQYESFHELVRTAAGRTYSTSDV